MDTLIGLILLGAILNCLIAPFTDKLTEALERRRATRRRVRP